MRELFTKTRSPISINEIRRYASVVDRIDQALPTMLNECELGLRAIAQSKRTYYLSTAPFLCVATVSIQAVESDMISFLQLGASGFLLEFRPRPSSELRGSHGVRVASCNLSSGVLTQCELPFTARVGSQCSELAVTDSQRS